MDKANIQQLVELSKHEYYFKAITVHRTHKDQRIDVPKGSFLEAIYKDMSDTIVIIKSTQTGISEYLIVRVLRRAELNKTILYVLPTFDLKGQFVKERIDKPIGFSPYYKQLVKDSNVARFAESMSLKQINKGSIAFVGSNTPNAFISFPADDIVIDEYDTCNQDNIVMAVERQSASKNPTTVYVGNPTITGMGLDKVIQTTDEKMWHIKHSCGKWIQPDFFKHVVEKAENDVWLVRDEDWEESLSRDINPICDKCHKPFDRYANGQWIKTREKKASGYRVSKMFSTFVTLRDMVNKFNAGLNDDRTMERFYNADLGLAYQPIGSKIFPYMLDACKADYHLEDHSDTPCVMGVDVGKVFHIAIARVISDGRPQVIHIGIAHEEEELYELYKRYKVKAAVIDGLPETRISKRFCARYRGAFRWFKHGEKADKIDPKTKTVLAYRTGLLDDLKETVMTESILLPAEAKSIEDFYDQVSAPTRLYNEDKLQYEWDEGSAADHYCFAMAFMVLAKKILTMVGATQSTGMNRRESEQSILNAR